MKINIVRWSVGIIGIIIIYAVINLFLVGGQKLYHSKDQKEFDSLKKSMESMQSDITVSESKLKEEESYLHQLEQKIDLSANSFQRTRAEQIYNYEYDSYEKMYGDYVKSIDSYNLNVKKLNDLAKKIGSTWYVVPIPRK